MKNKTLKSYSEITAERLKEARSFAKRMGVDSKKVIGERNRIYQEKHSRYFD